MNRHDVAIVGTGGIAAVHAQDLAALGDRARIVAAVDPDADRLAGFAAQWQVPGAYADLDAMLDAVKPGLVHLCTPPGLHAAQAIACLDRGVAVLCEKPPACSLAEFDAIAAAARRGGTHFAVVSQHRFGGGAIQLRKLIADGALGRPMTAVCHTLWYRPDAYFAVPWRGTWASEGGGPTMGHGIHQIDLLLSILGDWSEVVAVAARRARHTQTEDLSAALVTFADGTVATVVNSLLSPRETSYLRFDFEHATVELEHLYGYDSSNWRFTGPPDTWPAGGDASGHRAQFAAVFDALDAGLAPPVSDARRTLDLIASIYASAFTGRPVRSGEIGPTSPFYATMEGTGAPWASA
ncbi:MAG: Gfo/Idh/MocA family oxidoreductase [Hamadaea sp.]|nr:Gfo/Idh/MocA family oxidoreductase [Hamadaea sp.]